MIDEEWLAEQVRQVRADSGESPSVMHLRRMLQGHATEFADMRPDVATDQVVWPRRGLLDDEASSFLRAVQAGFVIVDRGGFVTLPTVRPKAPVGRYALLSKSGRGVSINLEYLVQIGATAELVLDHGWTPSSLDFERGEFDALGHDPSGTVVLAMEAKARASGVDSLEHLVGFWLRALRDPSLDRGNNSGRKLNELLRLCEHGPVMVWLVANGARWALIAQLTGAGLDLEPARSLPDPTSAASGEVTVIDAVPFDAGFHRQGTHAADGGCSWHGRTCTGTPIVSFVDKHGARQSGCERAVQELVERREMSPPRPAP